ncbi:MAG TPA: hypothetical protein VLA56_02925 [Pseudomonadales bacterium]|nr:hypothetical protein [Pseudomonadales bacterium]
MSDSATYAALYDPILQEIRQRSAVADAFLDKDIYRIYLATLWANVVSEPEASDLTEADLEPFHDFLDARAAEVLGGSDRIRACFQWLMSEEGDLAMTRTRVPARHREFLVHFGQLMLDPSGLGTRLEELTGRR